MGMHDQGRITNTKKLSDDSNLAENIVVADEAKPTQLRRMPHVFCKFLDLPFAADTHVVIEERRECYTFMVRHAGLREEDVVVEVVQIVPGSIKVTLRGANRIRAAGLTKNPKGEMENWRARLPACTIPEVAKAMYAQGIITIIIPKLLPVAQHPSPHRSCCTPQDMKRSLLCSNA